MLQISPGVDIVDVKRMEEIVRKGGDAFLTRVFTAQEIAYCRSQKMQYEHFAARFAAKEACIKSLGGSKGILALTDIQISQASDGRPLLTIQPSKQRQLGIGVHTTFRVSLAHERHTAIALVLAELDDSK